MRKIILPSAISLDGYVARKTDLEMIDVKTRKSLSVQVAYCVK